MAAILRVKDENGNIVSIPAIKGDKGEKGDPGEKGEKGERGEPGTVDGLPSGGYKGQSLVKSGDGNGEVEWGGYGREYSSIITVPTTLVMGDMQYINIAPCTILNSFVKQITQISEDAGTVLSDSAADTYALGYATTLVDLLKMQVASLEGLENTLNDIRENYCKVIDGGYISNPISIMSSGFAMFGEWKYEDNPIIKNTYIYAEKTSSGFNFQLETPRFFIYAQYYNNGVSDSDKQKYVCTGNWRIGSAYDNREEHFQSITNIGKIKTVTGDQSSCKVKYVSPTDLNLLQFTEQTLTAEQQSQALTNIGGLSKNQGTSNSGKFLGIGADGIVVPTEVGGGGGSSEWKTLFKGTITPTEAVNSMSADLLESCEGMNEFLVWFSNTKNEVESPGNDNGQIQVGKATYDYGRLGDLSNANEKIIHMILTDSITYSYLIYSAGNSLQYNSGGFQGGYANNRSPEYNKVKVACFSGTYLGTISLRVYGR